MSEYKHVIIDLFCGAGGFSVGLVKSIIEQNSEEISSKTGLGSEELSHRHPAVREWLLENVKLIAVNHDPDAVAAYREAHPWADVHNENARTVIPQEIAGDYDVDYLIAGPSCIPHSPAKGAKPSDKQLRNSPHVTADFLELTSPDGFIVENVAGFERWGPQDPDSGQMIKSGEMFENWLNRLKTMGYSVNWDILMASNYGVPQARKRLFVIGRRNYQPEFPDPTHSEQGHIEGTEPLRKAAEIIDWSNPGDSTWEKTRPLCNNTNIRIANGLKEHGHELVGEFAEALAWLTTDRINEMQENAVTIAQAENAAQKRDRPFLVEGVTALGDINSIDTAEGTEPASLCDAQLMAGQSGGTCRNVTDTPSSTITAKGTIHYINPEVFVLPRNGIKGNLTSNAAYQPGDRPLHTVTAKNHDGRIFEAGLIPLYTSRKQAEEHLPTYHQEAVADYESTPTRPFAIKYGEMELDGNDTEFPQFGRKTTVMCLPDHYPYAIDIRHRTIQPREAARAQGFSDSHELPVNTKKQKRKLIGNAVPVGLAKTMCDQLFGPTNAPTITNYND